MVVCENLTNGTRTDTQAARGCFLEAIVGIGAVVSSIPGCFVVCSNPISLFLCRCPPSMHDHRGISIHQSDKVTVVQCESGQQYNSGRSGDGGGEGYEVSRNGGATGRGVRQIEQRIIELRLRWAMRRIQERMVNSFQRRCEMRLFVIIRLQYLFRRRRSRIRAAVTIQRFIRPILRKHVVRHRH
jgi:hypothetical protein